MTAEASAFGAAQAPDFAQRFPWLGGDLQTLRNYLVGRPADLSLWPGRRILLPLRDGSGDHLAAVLHAPREECSRPLVVLIHGLTGCEDSLYIRASARHLLMTGYPVLRLNLRGAGPSGPFCSSQYHAGRSADLRDALISLSMQAPVMLRYGVAPVGYSLGGNMLIKFLAETKGAEAARLGLRAAAVVSAPIDLKASQARMMAPRNLLYHRYLITRMKREALAVLHGEGSALLEEMRRIRSVYAFDDRIVATRHGFESADHYYAACSGRNFLAEIETPALVLHALDDPWIPAKAYKNVSWAQYPALSISLLPHGGHVGFHGRGSQMPWHDRLLERFLTDAVSRKN